MVDALRHLSVLALDSEAVAVPEIDIIGLGATGSRIAMELTRLGFNMLRIWDDDTVEEHNIANQAYFEADIGKPKVVAAFEQINDISANARVDVRKEKYTGQKPLKPVVFLLTDTMTSRKEIFDKAIKYRPNVQLMIETRMGADSGQIFTLNPSDPIGVKRWEATWFPDEDAAEESACGARTSVGATAGVIAMLSCWTLIQWINNPAHDDNRVAAELGISIRPPNLIEI